MLPEQAKRAKRAGTRLVLVYGDIDGFKAINDNLGHARGDDVLQAVAAALREAFRATDLLARLGGDEFCVVAEADAGAEPETLGRRVDDAAIAAGECISVPLHMKLRHAHHRLARPRGRRRFAGPRRRAHVRRQACLARGRLRRCERGYKLLGRSFGLACRIQTC